MSYPPAAYPPPPVPSAPRKPRRRWPWVAGASAALVIALAGLLGQHPQPTPVPAAGLINATSSAQPVSTTTTAPPVPAGTTVPPVTTTVAPPPTQQALVPATHHTTTHATHPAAPPAPPAVHHTTTHAPAPPATQPPPAGGKYHAGEFCSTVGARATSTTGAPMTCLPEGKYKRWHND